MIRSLFIMYSPRIITTLVYMLQASDYRIKNYFEWLLRTRRFDRVMVRRKLDYTGKVVALVLCGVLLYVLLVAVAIYLAIGGLWVVAVVIVMLLPFILSAIFALIVLVGYFALQKPKERKIIATAQAHLATHTGMKIAIAGSYGKTTMKELLFTVLDSKLHVAASPGNMNTAIGLSRFATKLDMSEDVLIFELGEEKVGDVKRLCSIVRPKMGIITGINEAHLQTFKSVEQIIQTVFELQAYVGVEYTYKNVDSNYVASNSGSSDRNLYSKSGVNGWRVHSVRVDLEKTEFTATKGDMAVNVRTRLLGEHQIGPICACIDIANRLGMNPVEIEQALSLVAPFEHRMQPKHIGGALVIDDTYNGNINGVESGLKLLQRSQAGRKIYVSPGLVEQGDKTAEIHMRIGELIAPVADMVVLINNSTTRYIRTGLKKGNFTGELMIIDEPLEFYQNIQHFVAAGDVMLMQNDWTDNYA